MAPHITCHPLKVAVAHDGTGEEGFSVFADEALVAIFSLLRRTAPEELRSRWYLEAGFGPCEVAPAAHPLFDSLDAAQTWVLGRLS